MVPTLIFLIFILSLVLIKAADLVIVALRRISKQTKTGVFALSAIILAVGTSLPELFVGVTSAIEHSPDLALGVVLGSNIANTAFIAGFVGIIVGRINVYGGYLKKDLAIAFIAGVLPMVLILDKTLSRVDGLILLAVYGAYASSFFRERYMEVAQEHKKESFLYRFLRQFNHVSTSKKREFGRLFIGIALLLFSADMIVRISVRLGTLLNIPVLVIGLVILAIGTSLPELVFSLRSLSSREPSMFFGNLLGSTIANSTLIVGVTSLIYPIQIQDFGHYSLAAIFFLIVFILFWVFTRSKGRIDRWEASFLLLVYFVFVVFNFF
jgi:cation:H+ antiporter